MIENDIQLDEVHKQYYLFQEYLLKRSSQILGVPRRCLSIYKRKADQWQNPHLLTSYDRAIKRYGIYGDSVLVDNRLHASPFSIHQLILYKSKNGIDYVLYQHNAHFYFVLKNEDRLKFFMYMKRQIRECDQTQCEKPILPHSLVSSIEEQTIGLVKNSKMFKSMGVKIKRGVLLDGAPGNGKTMMCRYIKSKISNMGVGVIDVSSSILEKSYQDNALGALFQGKSTGLITASNSSFMFLFFDDIEISFFSRKSNPAMACSLLAAMDGMASPDNVVMLFTTNEKTDDIDPAFLRPGRIDAWFNFELPTEDLIRRLLVRWDRNITNAIGIDSIVEQTNGWSFAEIEGLKYCLVNNYMKNKSWDLNKAISEFHNNRTLSSNKRVGF